MPEAQPVTSPKWHPPGKGTTAAYHLGLFGAVAIWASTFINIKVVLLQFPPNTIAFLRFLLAGAALSPYLRSPVAIGRRDQWRLCACGLTGVTLYNFLQNQGLRWAGSTDAAIMASMAPVFLALGAWLLLRERIAGVQAAGIVIALAGSVLVVTAGTFSGVALNPLRIYGDVLVMLTGAAWAVYSILAKSLLARYPAPTVLAWSTLTGTLFLLPLALAEMPFDFHAVTLSGWLNILYLGLAASALAYLAWNLALTRVRAVTAAAYIYLIPVLTAGMAAIYYHQPPGLFVVIGGLTVLAGTYLTGRS